MNYQKEVLEQPTKQEALQKINDLVNNKLLSANIVIEALTSAVEQKFNR